jgi:hypothetical protein
MPVATEARTLASAEAVADFLFDNVATMYLPIILEGNTSYASEQKFFRLRRDAWREWGSFAPGQEPLLRDVHKTSTAWRTRMTPYLSRALDTNAITRLDAIWCYYKPKSLALEQYAAGTFNVQRQMVVAAAQLSNQETVDPVSVTEALAKIAALPVVPNLIVNEGDRLALLWKLSAPFTENALHSFQWEQCRSVWTMNRLAARLGQSGDFAHHPHLSVFDVPGLVRPTIKIGTARPGFTVTATVLHDELIAFEDLEAASK